MDYESCPGYTPGDFCEDSPKDTSCSLVHTIKEWVLGPDGISLTIAQKQAMGAAEKDQYTALLAASALRHLAGLSALESQAASIAPQGEARYRAIVDTYTESAVETVRGWQHDRR